MPDAFCVYIVDDEDSVCQALSRLMRACGYQTRTYGSPEQFLDGVAADSPGCVLMDITMPKMDGITALEQIMAFDKNAKVVMISALGKEELVKKALLLGAKNYIVKPLDRKKVLERIASVLGK